MRRIAVSSAEFDSSGSSLGNGNSRIHNCWGSGVFGTVDRVFILHCGSRIGDACWAKFRVHFARGGGEAAMLADLADPRLRVIAPMRHIVGLS